MVGYETLGYSLDFGSYVLRFSEGATNFRYLLANGLHRIYADFDIKANKAPFVISVVGTGETEPGGVWLATVIEANLVYHLYLVGEGASAMPTKTTVRALVFEYPEHGYGQSVKRVLTDYTITPDVITGNDQMRNGEFRKFNRTKVEGDFSFEFI